MNPIEIKKYLLESQDKLIKLLDESGFSKINVRTNEIRCAVGDDTNPTSIRVKLDENLTTTDFARNVSGDIVTLLQEKFKMSFRQTLKHICGIVGLNYTYQKIERYRIFGGFFDNIKISKGDIETEIKTYEEEILKEYDMCPNQRFLKDGISLLTQMEFNIGYDPVTGRITVPWRYYNGQICGIMGRWNGEDYKELDISKWYPIIEHKKAQTIYGYSENYNYLLNKVIYIFESEKGVMQLHSMGIRNAVALGRNSISTVQLKYLRTLSPKAIILCFDEGLEEEYIINECKKILPCNNLINYKVGYIWDDKNEILKKGSKDSPSDLGLENFKFLVKNSIKTIN